jgi:hypothetical protein
MMRLWRPAALIGIVALQACSYAMHQVHVSDFSPYRSLKQGKLVEGRGEQFTFMGFIRDTNYVEVAQKNLIEQCPKGEIQGVTTEYSTAHGFFSWTNRILMQGLCVQ